MCIWHKYWKRLLFPARQYTRLNLTTTSHIQHRFPFNLIQAVSMYRKLDIQRIFQLFLSTCVDHTQLYPSTPSAPIHFTHTHMPANSRRSP